jgi:hypothetical protein
LPWGRRVSLGLDFPFWLCHRSQLLGAIKGWFEDQSLNFFQHLMWWKLLFCLEAVIPKYDYNVSGRFLESQRSDFLFP